MTGMRLFQFPHSPYARKIQLLLDLLGQRHTTVDVPYTDRRELIALTGGYAHIPVLALDDGRVLYDSRVIAEYLVGLPGGEALAPPALAGPMAAYHDFCDGPLEDVLFRVASPQVREKHTDPWARALYTLIKERKFGAGCVDAWASSRDDLLARGRALLAPTVRTLAVQPFIFGDRPTLADAALHGLIAMGRFGLPDFAVRLGGEIAAWTERVDGAAAAARRRANPG